MTRGSGAYNNRKIETFDDFNSTQESIDYGVLQPLQFRDESEPLLDWLCQMDDLNKNASISRMETYRRNVNLYKGIHWKGENSSQRSPKQSVNFIYEMTEGKVSKLGTRKVAFTAIPRHNEQVDVNNAKSAKMLLDARCKEIDFDHLNTIFDRTMLQTGHAYFHVTWDKTAGGLHPDAELAAEAGEKVVERLQKELGTKESIFIGDADVSVLGANRVHPQMGKKELHKDVDYVDIVERVHVDELRARYPKFKDAIQESDIDAFYWEVNDVEATTGYVVLHKTVHRVTEFTPAGRTIIWTKDVVLEDKGLGLKHGMIPLIDDKDISVYEEYHGRSVFDMCVNLQRFYNLIQSFQARDISLASAPKWVYQKGTVKPTHINNELSGMEFKGPVAPKLVSHNPTSTQGFEIQDRLENKIGKMFAVYDMSRGEVPQGVTANSALRFLDEQEAQRLGSVIANRNTRIVKTLNMMMSTMGQFYKEGDGRTIRTVGEDNSYLIRDLSKTDFTKVYSIDIQKTSALPDTKTGKIAAITDLNQVTQTDPVFKRAEIIQMLDLGHDKAFIDRSTVAIDAARTVLQDILEGQEVAEPQEYDSLIVHYNVLTDALEENWFKQRVDESVQKIIADRVAVIEGLMWMRAQKNLKFAVEVSEVSKYPIFFTPPIPIHQIILMAQTPPPEVVPTSTENIEVVNKEQE